jgi:hypothetical protein
MIEVTTGCRSTWKHLKEIRMLNKMPSEASDDTT